MKRIPSHLGSREKSCLSLLGEINQNMKWDRSPVQLKAEWRQRGGGRCILPFISFTHKVIALGRFRWWTPLFPHTATTTPSNRLRRQAGGRRNGSVWATFMILACVTVRIWTLMPHLLRKSTRDFQLFRVMRGLKFPFPSSCKEGLGF